MEKTILSVKDLHVSFHTYLGEIMAVRGVTFDVKKGEALALVGESGCGKSVTAKTILKLNPSPPSRIKSGDITLDGIDIVSADEKSMGKIRGAVAGMVFQDPMTSLNPTMPVGKQISEALVLHTGISRAQAREKAVRILKEVRIPDAEHRARQYPGEFSGGMRQRAMIGIAVACGPKLLIADEPTTALDVTIQAQILDLLRSIQKISNTSIIMITHDMGVAAGIAQRVAVMYAGRIVEIGTAAQIYHACRHPYTKGLLDSLPKSDQNKDADLPTIGGTPPSLLHPPRGCGFASRCTSCMRICKQQDPPSFFLGEGHECSCWLLHPDAKKAVRSTGKE